MAFGVKYSRSVTLPLPLSPQLIQTLKRLMRPSSVEFKSPLELSAEGENTTLHVLLSVHRCVYSISAIKRAACTLGMLMINDESTNRR